MSSTNEPFFIAWGHYPPDMDLKGANLSGADLRETDLSGADLREADLSGADLREADLSRSDLSCANFSGTNLSEANLTKADLSEANLFGANLSRAELSGANLTKADLSKADLSEANLSGTCLIKADLRGAILSGDITESTSANLTNADLRQAIFTPEGEPIDRGSFLDLASCFGIETAKFSKPDFLPNYLNRAFEYAHKADTYEGKKWPEFIKSVIKKIRVLRSLYSDDHPPKQIIEVVGVITSELIKYLKKHPKALYEIKPRQFEELIAEILASYGWRVELTPSTKDGGYDIYAITKNIEPGVETSWIIECKKYAPENKVGVDIVRALYGIKSNLKIANALLATTSYFTKGAKAFKASRYDVELKDYYNILEWINQYRPNPNGKLYIKDNRLIVLSKD